MPAHEQVSSGVQALIERLRDEGVQSGQREAEQIIADAQAEAHQVLAQAEAKAKQRLAKAQEDADKLTAAAREALRIAARDTTLDFKERLMVRFSGEVKRLVSEVMKDREIIARMVLEVTRRVRDQAKVSPEEPVEVLLPEDVLGLEYLRRNPEELERGDLTQLVFDLTGEMLRDGITLGSHSAPDGQAGILLRYDGKEVSVDLSDAAITAVILDHLQPRFRALLEGIVK